MTKSVEQRIAAITVALLFGLASHAMAQPNFDELADKPAVLIETARKYFKWDELAEPAKILGPIYFVGTKGLSVFLITTTDGHILLNTGMPGSGPMIESSIRTLGFKPEEIKILLTGHAHLDHAGGHAYLKKLSGARVAVIHEEKELLESGGKLDFQYGKIKEFEFEPAKVDWVFHDGDSIKLGDIEMKALLTGGHTKGATTFVMDVVDNGTKYKVVFPTSTSVNPGYRLVKDPSYAGIADDFRRTFGILSNLKFDIWLLQHNETYDFEAKLARSSKHGAAAWIDPEGYKTWLKSQRAKFDATVDRETKQE